MFSRTTRPRILALLMALALGGCASLGGEDKLSQEQQRQLRTELNEGYSLLYASAKSLSSTDKAFYVKFESDRVQKVITSVSDYAGELKSDLERIANDYPAVDIDLDPLPEIEKRKRSAISSDTLKSLTPVVGKTGAAFEIKLLLASAGALDQLQYLCAVIAEEEPEPSLRDFLGQIELRFARLYDDVVVVLNEDYFKHNTYVPPNRDG